ncbi:protein-tyrosine-phosphatase [Catellatospora sp. TT07R-123]|uniref:tyrosine-protein phosphatase n=1 Tax=Catellatospora sp. TT07R-123 TaxID=2733863 RepID=UPI001B2CE40E|nr:tyrosine-protein phosphatase [Catellatospora sp. TT07R-123]GHJ48027.1 protein-tyrosine-phosphatase [Catellatospora sp. TT07R-123]
MILDWPDCVNARDVGGLPTVDGGRVRDGALLRSDRHDRMTEATVRAVRAAGVNRILDLRWSWECAEFPSPFAGDDRYRHTPLLNDVLDYVPPPDGYVPMLDHNQARIGAAFRAVAEAPPGAVLIHCHSGRDRTGVLVALLLRVAGVGEEDVAADYALTDRCAPAPMLKTLAHLEQRHGGAEAYLAGAGVTAAELDAVRARLLA